MNRCSFRQVLMFCETLRGDMFFSGGQSFWTKYYFIG